MYILGLFEHLLPLHYTELLRLKQQTYLHVPCVIWYLLIELSQMFS